MVPKVFVSYSHDNEAHKARVAEFVARLRADGIEVVYDQDLARRGGPDEGWPRWCERQIAECDYVLACCTPLFHERFDGEPGSGVGWEAPLIRQYLYESTNRKIRPLIFEPVDQAHIPSRLRPYHVFLPKNDQSYAELLGWLKADVTPSPPPSSASFRDTEHIFQGQAIVGKAFGGRRLPNDATTFEFVEITNCNQFNPIEPFYFEGVKLRFVSNQRRIGLDISRPQDGMILGGVLAMVVE